MEKYSIFREGIGYDTRNLLFLTRMFYEKKRTVLGTEIRSVCPSFLTWDSKKICKKVKNIGMEEGSSKCIAPDTYLVDMPAF